MLELKENELRGKEMEREEALTALRAAVVEVAEFQQRLSGNFTVTYRCPLWI